MDDYVSIHGICFDEGNSGRCGLECRGLDDCDERENIIDDAISNGITFNELLDLEIFTDDAEIYELGLGGSYLIDKYIGEFRLAVLKAQTKFKFNEEAYLIELIYKPLDAHKWQE